jgi:hypothetical protein
MGVGDDAGEAMLDYGKTIAVQHSANMRCSGADRKEKKIHEHKCTLRKGGGTATDLSSGRGFVCIVEAQ